MPTVCKQSGVMKIQKGAWCPNWKAHGTLYIHLSAKLSNKESIVRRLRKSRRSRHMQKRSCTQRRSYA